MWRHSYIQVCSWGWNKLQQSRRHVNKTGGMEQGTGPMSSLNNTWHTGILQSDWHWKDSLVLGNVPRTLKHTWVPLNYSLTLHFHSSSWPFGMCSAWCGVPTASPGEDPVLHSASPRSWWEPRAGQSGTSRWTPGGRVVKKYLIFCFLGLRKKNMLPTQSHHNLVFSWI